MSNARDRFPLPAQESTFSRSDPWFALRRHTAARIALGRSGASLPTREVLAFGVAHAQARDAVHAALDVEALAAELETEGLRALAVRSRVGDRGAYLARPDWGRRVHPDSVALLVGTRTQLPPDIVFVLKDGLSAIATQRHATPLLRVALPLLDDLSCGPIVIATQARVALADEVGEILGARLVVSLIGERPGLSAPDSLGAYVTFAPRIGRVDAERNCLSNIRPEGLSYETAALQLAVLIHAALQARLSGVDLRFDPEHSLTQRM